MSATYTVAPASWLPVPSHRLEAIEVAVRRRARASLARTEEEVWPRGSSHSQCANGCRWRLTRRGAKQQRDTCWKKIPTPATVWPLFFVAKLLSRLPPTVCSLDTCQFGQATSTLAGARARHCTLHSTGRRSHLSHLVEHQVRPLGLRRVAAPRDELGAQAAGRRRHAGARRKVLARREHLRHAHCTRTASGRGAQQGTFDRCA